jgi:hypothetical protein
MVPPELTSRAWLAVQTKDGASLLPWLGHVRGRYTWLHKALEQRDHWVLVEDSDWLFLFAPSPHAGLPKKLNLSDLSRMWGESCWFSLQDGAAVRRYRRGEQVRRVERLGQGALIQEGRPGQKREPSLAPFDAESVLGFAEAWHCDPRPLLRGKTRAWLLEPKVVRAYPRPPRPREPNVLLWLVLALFLGAASYGWYRGSSERPVVGLTMRAAIKPCHEMFSCESCTTCASAPEGACASHQEACERDRDCSALSLCFTGCGLERMRRFLDLKGQIPAEGFQFDFSCDAACIDSHPEGARVYRAWRTCTSCDTCTDLCDWQVRLGSGDMALADCAVSEQDTVPPLGR